MATNKHTTIRYLALDKCFRNPGRKYFMEDLVDTCDDVLFNYNIDSQGIEKPTIFDDNRFMESNRGLAIGLLKMQGSTKTL